VAHLAARRDVQSVSPKRLAARMATTLTPSQLEQATGVTGVRTRSQAAGLGYQGLDGSGAGVAVLDSRVLFKHRLFDDATGARDWTPGLKTDDSALLGEP
jgi:hypothetical protein